MIEINTPEDIKLIKEFAKVFSDNLDSAQIVSAVETSQSIQELKKSNELLSQKMIVLHESQKGLLKTLDKILEYLEKTSNTQEASKTEVVEAAPKKERKVRNGELPFEPYIQERKEYQSIILDDINLIHEFVANEKNGTQKYMLPVNLFELLIIAETFAKGNRSITNKKVKELCELFSITRAQFSKVYYNLTIGKFNGILSQIDKLISDSIFTIQKSHIYRNNHDTNIDKKEFTDLVNIYANAEQSFLTIYRLIKEKSEIDPIDLLVVLKKSDHVSNAFQR